MWVTGVDRDKPGYGCRRGEDTEKAQAAIDKGVKEDGKKVKEASYEGVDYQVDEDGVGRHRRRLLHGRDRAGVQAHGQGRKGDSLAEDKRFSATVDELDDDRIGLFYIDIKPVFEQAIKADPQAAPAQQIRQIFPIDKLEPMGGALLADGERIRSTR